MGAVPEDQKNPDVNDNQQIIQVVGNYIVGPTIGKGFFAKVKRVEDQYKQVYAMKCFDKESISRNAHSLRQVEKEINALRLCQHPHIAKFHEVLEVENSVYLIMEYASNGELFDYIKEKGKLTESEAAHFASQILNALLYCHDHGIAHRDVKPENILIDSNYDAKLVDFGLCSFFMENGDNHASYPEMNAEDDLNSLTPKQVVLHTQCGSPHYAAPEVLMGSGYHGPSSDVWSFGVLLYAMVTGTLPFNARIIPHLIQKIIGGVYRIPSHLSPLCKHLISGLLRVNPTDRLSIEQILNHPWLAKTEPWIKPANATAAPKMYTSVSKTMDVNTVQKLTLFAAAQAAKKTVCNNCGGCLSVKTTPTGLVKLGENTCHCAHSIFKSTNDKNQQQTAVLMPLPKLFENETLEDVAVTLSPVEQWRPTPLDYSKAVCSDREYSLFMACEKGDLKAVRQILYESVPCPLVLAKIYGDHGSASKVLSRDNSETNSCTKDGKSIFICGGSNNSNSGNNSNMLQEPGSPTSEPLQSSSSAPTHEDLYDLTLQDYRLRSCLCTDSAHRLDLRVGGLDKWTCLHFAARAGHVDVCEELLLSCLPLNVNAQTKNAWTPLMFAADKGHAKVVSQLLQFRADIHTTSSDGKTAVFLAREHNYKEISQLMTETSSVRHLNKLQHHSIIATDAHETIAQAAFALSQNTRNSANSKSVELAPLRIARASRASWFALSNLQSDLINAAESGDVALLEKLFSFSVQLLEGKSYDVDRKDLASVVEHGDVQVVIPPSLSVPPTSNAQVDLFARGTDNWTIFHHCARRGQTVFLGKLLEQLVVHVNVEEIINLMNSTTKSGWTPLMMAVDKGHLETTRLLLKCGADLTVATKGGETVTSIAKSNEAADMIQLISEYSKE